MAKWIEMNNGTLLNLDMVGYVRKYEIPTPLSDVCHRYRVEYYTFYNPLPMDVMFECFNDENKRDRRFEEIKAMLIEE